MDLLLILSPNLKTSSMKASKLLENIGSRFDILLLKFPVEMEEELTKISFGNISTDKFIDEAEKRNLIPKPVGAWEYSARPILDVLPKLGQKFPDLSFQCYSNSKHEFASVNMGVEIAKLILRTTITGNVEVGEWRETLYRSLDVNKEARMTQAEAIMERSGERSICVSDMGGRYLTKDLKKIGIFVRIQYVEKPYHFNPLMILERLMANRFVKNEEIETLVRSHLEYIRSYVYIFDNRDRAHYEWVYAKVPWMRQKIDKEELNALDNIINSS